MDFVYAGRYGVRASGAAWYDDAYSNGRSHSNPNVTLSQIPSYTGNEYSHHVQRYYRGPSAALLDAFAFGKINVGGMRVSAKDGRFTAFRGASLLVVGDRQSVDRSVERRDGAVGGRIGRFRWSE